MTLVSRSIKETPDNNGNFSTVSPVVTADVTWATVPNFLSNAQGSAFSQEFRSAYLSGTGAATATFTLVDVAGDSAATLGLAFSGDNLESAAGTVGQGSFQVIASYSGTDYYSNVFVFEVATTSADTQEPTAPLIRSLTAVGNTQIDLQILPPMDPLTPTSTADGMASVEIHRSVSGGAYSLLATKSISPGISPQLIRQTIGSVEVSQAEQTGANWSLATLNSLGIFNGNAAGDELTCAFAQVTGDFNLYAKIPEYIGAAGAYTMGGLMVRQSLAATAKFYYNGRLSNPTSAPTPQYSEVKFRSVLGGQITPLNPQDNLSGDVWFWINRTDDVFTSYIFRPGDPGWTQNHTGTLVMTGAVYAGLVAANDYYTPTAFVSFEEVTLQNLAIVTHSDTGLSENTRYDYKARGVSL